MKKYYFEKANKSSLMTNTFQFKLKKTNENFYKAFNLAPVLFAVSTLNDGKYISVNNKFLNTLEYTYEEVIGKTSEELYIFTSYSDREKAKAIILKEGRITNFESRIRTKTGCILTVLFYGETIDINNIKHLLTVAVDISKQKEIERKIALFDRLNVVGKMAAAIAHEIRNPLTTIRGFLQLEKMKNQTTIDNEYMNIMIEELDRANGIITEYLSFAKTSESNFEKKNLNSIIRAIYPLIQANAIKDNKAVILELSDVPDLLLNTKEIKQLVFNISRNGLEAMKENEYLTIRTYSKSKEIVLEIADIGKGIPLEIIEKLGEPFLTTKTYGNGLGLSVCYKIAAKHNAIIEVDTDSTGTIFIIKFKI